MDFFRQKTVDLTNIRNGIIKARIEGQWNEYKIIPLPDKFIEWNLKARLIALEGMTKGIMPPLSGPHSGCIASYGAGREDSHFTLNNAVKGVGFVPHPGFIKDRMQTMERTINAPMVEKLKFLRSLYQEKDKIDFTKQVSLELYTTPNFKTHSFLNLMENPLATIVFPDIPSFELRTICRIVSTEDADVSEDEKDILNYTNLVHSYFHGTFSGKFPVLIFYVIEIFDNTPGEKDGMGKRIEIL